MSDTPAVEVSFQASRSRGEVSALLRVPERPAALLVLAHGAGAGMSHPFLEALARRLALGGVATFRYQFPYMEEAVRSGRRRRPDFAPILETTVRSAVATAVGLVPGVPVLAGGKSMGGRMTSRAEAAEPMPGLGGLVFYGFPLHPAGRPGTERASHLSEVRLPMLFLQGTRDRLAELQLLEPMVASLGKRARLHLVEGADHAFQVLKRSGRSREQVLDELAATTCAWAQEIA